MNQLKSILVGIDYSEPSTAALREAARIAHWDHANITAIHIIDSEVLRDIRRSVDLEVESVKEQAKLRLGRHLESVLGPGHGVDGHVTSGHPFQEMSRAAERCAAELLVLGSHGGAGDSAYRVGILAERCLRKLKQNVLLVRAHQSQPFKRVVACVDFSDNSRRAATQAVHIAQQEGAELEFLHVRQPISSMVEHPDFYTGTPPSLLPNLDSDLAGQLEKQLQTFAASLMPEGAGLDPKVTVLQDVNHRDAIVGHISETGADLVVLGTRGHTSLRNLLMGSTAERLIHRSRCCALAVKPQGFEFAID